MFTVKILKTKNVSVLKDLIKEKKASHFDHIAASDLDLWQVSFPIKKFPPQNPNPPTGGLKLTLKAHILLSDAFPSKLNINSIHVVVGVPDQGDYYIGSGSILLIIPSRYYLSYLRATAICI